MRNTDFSYDKTSILSSGEGCDILSGTSLTNHSGLRSGERLNANIEHNNYSYIAELAKEFIRKNFARNIGVDDIAKKVLSVNIILAEYLRSILSIPLTNIS